MASHRHSDSTVLPNAWLSEIEKLGSLLDGVFANTRGEIWLFDNDLEVIGDTKGFELLYKRRIDGTLAGNVRCIKLLLRKKYYREFLRGDGKLSRKLCELRPQCLQKFYVGELEAVKPKPPLTLGARDPWIFYLGTEHLLSSDGIVIVRPRVYPFHHGRDVHDSVAIAWPLGANEIIKTRLSAADWFARVFSKEVRKWFKSLNPEVEIDRRTGRKRVKSYSVCKARTDDELEAIQRLTDPKGRRLPVLPPVDCGIITALPVEQKAVREVLKLKRHTVSDTDYYVGRVFGATGHLTVASAVCAEAGSVESALVTAKMLQVWRPRNVFLVGICGGRDNRENTHVDAQHLKGDVIVADKICPYEYVAVKETESPTNGAGDVGTANAIAPNGETTSTAEGNLAKSSAFQNMDQLPESHDFKCEGPYVERAFMMADGSWTITEDDMNARFPAEEGNMGRDFRRAFKGSLGSGCKLARSGQWFADMRQKWHRKLEGIEMEAEGVGMALKKSGLHSRFLVIKGIVDYGDLHKDDAWHELASETAARFLAHLLSS